MNLLDFPKCCGIKICANFGNTKTAIDQNNYTPEEIDKFLCNNLSNYYQHIATINSDQYKIVAPILRKYKFRQVSKFKYAGHGNVIYTYIRIPQND